MSGFVKCVDVAPGSDTTTFQIQAGINTYTLTSQKWVDWVAELPGRGKVNMDIFQMIWGFGRIFYVYYGANYSANYGANYSINYGVNVGTNKISEQFFSNLQSQN